MTFGDTLKKKREEKGFTQDQLADLLRGAGNRQTISEWERGKTYPKVETLLELSVILETSLDELFLEEIQYYKKKCGKDAEKCPEGVLVGIKNFAEALEKNRKQMMGGNGDGK